MDELAMLGAIVGDIIGSVYEFDNHRSKDFEPDCKNPKQMKMANWFCRYAELATVVPV